MSKINMLLNSAGIIQRDINLGIAEYLAIELENKGIKTVFNANEYIDNTTLFKNNLTENNLKYLIQNKEELIDFLTDFFNENKEQIIEICKSILPFGVSSVDLEIDRAFQGFYLEKFINKIDKEKPIYLCENYLGFEDLIDALKTLNNDYYTQIKGKVDDNYKIEFMGIVEEYLKKEDESVLKKYFNSAEIRQIESGFDQRYKLIETDRFNEYYNNVFLKDPSNFKQKEILVEELFASRFYRNREQGECLSETLQVETRAFLARMYNHNDRNDPTTHMNRQYNRFINNLINTNPLIIEMSCESRSIGFERVFIHTADTIDMPSEDFAKNPNYNYSEYALKQDQEKVIKKAKKFKLQN